MIVINTFDRWDDDIQLLLKTCYMEFSKNA
mgnify:CR=1 FL=1